VKRFVQQAGQFGVPAWEELLVYLNRITSPMWYAPPIQQTVSFSNYWRDPMHLDLYQERSTFLADLNNERTQKNSTYAERLSSLDQFVLIASTVDRIIVPRESSWFSAFAPNSTSRLVSLRESALYTEDWIGLRALDESGRLRFASCECHHRQVPTPACKVQVWEPCSRRFLQPQPAIRALLRWLRPPEPATAPPEMAGPPSAVGKPPWRWHQPDVGEQSEASARIDAATKAAGPTFTPSRTRTRALHSQPSS